MDTDFLQADWLQELPEDLDMLIAQRNFEGAVDLVEKGNRLWRRRKQGIDDAKNNIFLTNFTQQDYSAHTWLVAKMEKTIVAFF